MIPMLLAAALAAEPVGPVQGTVAPVMAVLPPGAKLPDDPPFTGPSPAGDPCPDTAPRDATGDADDRVVVTACDGVVHLAASGAWARVDDALPTGTLAGLRVRRAPDGELVVVAWTDAGFLRASAWRPAGLPPLTVATRTAPVGPPLPWPTVGPSTLGVRARVDSRLPMGPRVLAVWVDAHHVVLGTTTRAPDGERATEIRIDRGPR